MGVGFFYERLARASMFNPSGVGACHCHGYSHWTPSESNVKTIMCLCEPDVYDQKCILIVDVNPFWYLESHRGLTLYLTHKKDPVISGRVFFIESV